MLNLCQHILWCSPKLFTRHLRLTRTLTYIRRSEFHTLRRHRLPGSLTTRFHPVEDMSLIIFDFDGTVTEKDTINTLAQSAISHSHDVGASAAQWDEIVKAYVTDYERHVASYNPGQADRREVAAELEFLESLRDIEKASVARVEGSGLFKGIRREEFAEFGREAVASGEVRLRKGFEEFVEVLAKKGWEMGVVSVNWSGDFIEGVLDRRKMRKMLVNRVKPDGIIEGPRELAKADPLLTAGEKTKAARVLVEEWRARSREERGWVYIGDSMTDLGCLIEASMGIVMAENKNSRLLQALERVGFGVSHVADWKPWQNLVWARDLEEVLESKVLNR